MTAMRGRLGLYVILSVWGVGMLGIGAAVSLGHVLPRGGQLLYTTRSTQVPQQTHLLDVAHSLSLTVLRIPKTNLYATWSPDGAYIASMTMDHDRWYLTLSDLSSGQAQRYPAWMNADNLPQWSPDGLHLAFNMFRNNHLTLSILNVRTGDITFVDAKAQLGGRVWSPDGRWLVFHVYSAADTSALYAIGCTENDCAAKGTAIFTAMGALDLPQWSPDGRFIVMMAVNEEGQRLYRMTIACDDLINPDCFQDLTPLTDSEAFSSSFKELTWSPNSQYVAFIYYHYYDNQYSIEIVNVVNGERRRLTATNHTTVLAWSPDSRSIAFENRTYRSKAIIQAVNVETGTISNLLNSQVDIFDPMWRP